MKTRFTRSGPPQRPGARRPRPPAPQSRPRVRLRCRPSLAVRQNWQLTAQPTWLETQIVARCQLPSLASAVSLASVPSLSVAGLAVVALRHPDSFHGLICPPPAPGSAPSHPPIGRPAQSAAFPPPTSQPTSARSALGSVVISSLRNSLTIERFRQLLFRARPARPPPPCAPSARRDPGQRAACGSRSPARRRLTKRVRWIFPHGLGSA